MYQVKAALQKMALQQDTLHGVHIQSDSTATYGSLVKTLNAFKQENWVTYCVSAKETWAWYALPEPSGLKMEKWESAQLSVAHL